MQPTVELNVLEQATFGVWGNFPLDRLAEELKQELNIYLSYSVPLGLAELTLGAAEYIYPEDEIDNDRELSIEIALDTLLNPSLSVFLGIGGGIKDSQFFEINVNEDIWSFDQLSFNLGTTLAYSIPDEGDQGFNHALISLSAGHANLNASANWVFETNDRVNDLSSQETFYLAVGAGYTF